MKNILKKIGYSLLVFSLSFTYNAANIISAAPVCNGTSGNLYGYINTENLGPVYLSTESWNAENSNTTTMNFSVSYNRQMGVWSGRGWAPGTPETGVIGWVDFSYDQINHKARFEAPIQDYEGSKDKWGNWSGIVDLSSVAYSTQNGSFRGTGLDSHTDTGGTNSETNDDHVGSGEWTFAHVEFQDPACPQNVNLFLEESSRLHRSSCDIDKILIQWTTENIVPGSCKATAGLWTLQTPRSDQNTGTNTFSNAPVTALNTPVVFKLECTGAFDDQRVEGIAVASCGEFVVDPNNPLNMISPILTEA